jgi:hypothetical protein
MILPEAVVAHSTGKAILYGTLRVGVAGPTPTTRVLLGSPGTIPMCRSQGPSVPSAFLGSLLGSPVRRAGGTTRTTVEARTAASAVELAVSVCPVRGKDKTYGSYIRIEALRDDEFDR